MCMSSFQTIFVYLFSVVSCGSKINGFNFLNGQWSGPKYNSQDAEDMVSSIINQTGANWIQFTFCWYQPTIESTGPIAPKTGTSPTDDELQSIFSFSQSNNLKTIMRPCVDPTDMSNGEWRGEIGCDFNSTQWDSWFESYMNFINYYANLAVKLNVDMFVIGLELICASHQASHFINVANSVKDIFSKSNVNIPIRYDANHGNEREVEFWSDVDYIGIDAYYPIDSSNNSPSVDDLIRGWEPIVSNLSILSQENDNKGIIFGEIGYCSSYATNVDPAHCYQSSQLNMTAQMNAYNAVFQTIYQQDYFNGILWWSWLTDPNDSGDDNTGFTVNNKPTAALCNKYFN